MIAAAMLVACAVAGLVPQNAVNGCVTKSLLVVSNESESMPATSSRPAGLNAPIARLEHDFRLQWCCWRPAARDTAERAAVTNGGHRSPAPIVGMSYLIAIGEAADGKHIPRLRRILDWIGLRLSYLFRRHCVGDVSGRNEQQATWGGRSRARVRVMAPAAAWSRAELHVVGTLPDTSSLVTAMQNTRRRSGAAISGRADGALG